MKFKFGEIELRYVELFFIDILNWRGIKYLFRCNVLKKLWNVVYISSGIVSFGY